MRCIYLSLSFGFLPLALKMNFLIQVGLLENKKKMQLIEEERKNTTDFFLTCGIMM
jgi:hypothetical protein